MKKIDLIILVISLILLTGCAGKTGKTTWNINEAEYLETQGFNVFAFHNDYPVGDQGGIEFIHHGERTASNGFIKIGNSTPGKATRIVDKEKMELRTTVNIPELKMNYDVRIWPVNNTIHLAVDFQNPIPEEYKDKVTFDLQLFPVTYTGKTYSLGEQTGVLPVEAMGPMSSESGEVTSMPLARGSKLVLAAEDPFCKLQIENVNGELSLIDTRNTNLSGWIIVRSVIPAGAGENAMEWVITPEIQPDWVRDPVISISQVGYHPEQIKKAIIELDVNSKKVEKAVLHKINGDGIISDVKSANPAEWGKFLRYNYRIFDFSEIKEPGLYSVSYGEIKSNPFKISRDAYQQSVWQPTLEIYFPVQMCHMRVRDRGRVWHGACHLDDAVQAPLSTIHVDGYRTYASTETQYKPFEPIPGLNRGGWHDAGDYDLAAGAQARTTMYLALAGEEFGISTDQTTVNKDALLVDLRRPDGISDLQQQIEHGVLNLLSGYRISGHSFTGIIETRAGRNFFGDVASVSDQLLYDTSLRPDEIRGNRSGKPDDRWAVTNKDTSLEYEVMAALLAASRVLRGYNDALADECLQTAIKAWDYEQSHEPVKQPNAYIQGNYERKEVLATCELLLTTKDSRYKEHLLKLMPVIKEVPGEIGWAVARVMNMIGDENFKNELRAALQNYKVELDKTLAENPFGVPWRPRIWGVGWDIQKYAVSQYYLNRAFPEMFDRENVCRVVNFVLGCHPGSSTSFVSAVGAHSIIPAYGINMHWWSYIPGGMVSGTALIRPDFPEMKEPYPYIWQQTEYVMHGASTYIFCVLAADKLLNDNTRKT